jgi:hypothetical protein
MNRIKLDFASLTVPDKITVSNNIVNKMTNNPSFVSPDPTLAEVSQKITALNTAYLDAMDGGKTKTTFMHQCEDDLDDIMVLLADYVQFISKGSEQIILSSGMGVKSRPSASGTPSTPEDLKATAKGNAAIDLKWAKVDYAKSYDIQKASNPNDNGSWVHAATSTSSKFTIENLVVGTKYWFRVAAIGASSAKSNYSAPTSAMAIE